MEKTIDELMIRRFDARTRSFEIHELKKELSKNGYELVKRMLRDAKELDVNYLELKKAIILADDYFYNDLIRR